MAIPRQLRRGTTAECLAYNGYEGELIYDSDKKALRLYDGIKAGGYLIGSTFDNTDNPRICIRDVLPPDNTECDIVYMDGQYYQWIDGRWVLLDEAAFTGADLHIDLTNLLGLIDKVKGDLSYALGSLGNLVDGQISSSIVQLKTNITDLKNDVYHSETGVDASSRAIDGLITITDDSETGVIASATKITLLTADIKDPNSSLYGSGTALGALTTRVTSTEGEIDVVSGDLVSLSSVVGGHTTALSGQATAISGLTTSVSTLDGTISSTASDLTSLSTTVGENISTISTLSSSVNGISAEHTVEIDINGRITGTKIYATGTRTDFNVLADKFAITAPGATGATFTVESGIVKINGDLIVNGSINTTQLGYRAAADVEFIQFADTGWGDKDGLQIVNYTPTNYPTGAFVALLSLDFTNYGGDKDAFCRVHMTCDGVTITKRCGARADADSDVYHALTFSLAMVGTGNSQITATVTSEGSGGREPKSILVYGISLNITGIKK